MPLPSSRPSRALPFRVEWAEARIGEGLVGSDSVSKLDYTSACEWYSRAVFPMHASIIELQTGSSKPGRGAAPSFGSKIGMPLIHTPDRPKNLTGPGFSAKSGSRDIR